MADSASPKRPKGERLMRPAQASAMLGVTPRALIEWGNARKLTVLRTLGGHRRYRADEVRALAASLTVEAEAVSA